jgi:hypothetical protein
MGQGTGAAEGMVFLSNLEKVENSRPVLAGFDAVKGGELMQAANEEKTTKTTMLKGLLSCLARTHSPWFP